MDTGIYTKKVIVSDEEKDVNLGNLKLVVGNSSPEVQNLVAVDTDVSAMSRNTDFKEGNNDHTSVLVSVVSASSQIANYY